jgi:TonB-linked SusC/RagA family outer membrane protein
MKKYILIFISTLLSSILLAQSKQISGCIKDVNGNTIPGVSIVVKGTTKGTVSDLSGNFAIKVNDGDVLMFSFIGMKKQEVTVGKKSIINIVMNPANELLEEIVVLGYGNMSKKDITGSVSKITSKDFEGQHTTTADQILQGRIAGVQVIGGGTPGNAMKVQIRGANSLLGDNSPLYVVDGVPITSGSTTASNGLENLGSSQNSNIMSLLDPSQIESIDVLKDASATAIYGSQGANGVVMITTKKGVTSKPTITVSSDITFNTVAKYIQIETPWQFAESWNEIRQTYPGNFTYNGKTTALGVYWPSVDEIKNNPDKWGVDWQKEIFKNSITQQYTFSVSQKIANTNYNISVSNLNDPGVLMDTYFKRTNFSTNLNSSLWDNRLTYGANVYYSISNGSNKSSAGNSQFNRGVVNTALYYNNIFPVYNADGTFYSLNEDPNNPAAGYRSHPINYIKNTKDISDSKYFIFAGYAELRILKNLKLKSTINNVLNNSSREGYWPNTVWRGATTNGFGSKTSIETSKMVYENYLTYDVKIKGSSLNAVAGFSYQEDKYINLGVSSSNFPSNDFDIKDISSGQTPYPSTDSYVYSQLLSYYGRLNYNIKNRYLLTFTGRADGSSKFGANNKWGYFPSGAFAWRVTEEKFMKNIAEQVSNLKLRASYGLTGSQAISPYQSMAKMGAVGYYFGDTYTTGYAYNSVQNPNLRWETTKTFNVGMDLGLLKNKINIIVDWYDKNTEDLLWQYQMARETGFDIGVVNLGNISNSGLEIAISGSPVKNNSIEWNSALTYTRNKNKVVEFINPASSYDIVLGAPLWGDKIYPNVFMEGQPLGMFYGWKTNGILQTQAEANALTYNNGWASAVPGEYKFVDVSGPNGTPDGIIDNYDRTLIGNPNPDFLLNWNNSIQYKNFTLNLNFNCVYGGDIFNITGAQLNENRGYVGAAASNDSWSPFNPTNAYRKIRDDGKWDAAMLDRYIEDGTYLRLKTLSLGYKLNVKKGSLINWINFNMAVNNAFTISKYTGYNPDVSDYNSNVSKNFDSGGAPTVRAYTFSVKFGL